MPTDLETLGRAVKQVQWRHHRALDAALAGVGSSLAQWDALRAIAQNPGANAHALAVATFQSDQSFGALANRLVARDLIERRPGHGRQIVHHLTPSGELTVEAGHKAAAEVFRGTFASLSEKERATLLELLTRIAAG